MNWIKQCIAGMVLFCLCLSGQSMAQKYKSISSSVHFFSDAPMEDIEATNVSGQSALDLSTNSIVFSIPVAGFEFEKSLMQEHFNENYMESDKYPQSTFKGKLSGFNPGIKSWQEAKAEGMMYIHGEENSISVTGQIKIEGDQIEIEAKFPVALEEYKIKIPKVVFYNIAEIVEVTISFKYEKID